jgi:probable HAF family extracellular repeat protein
MKLKSGLAVVSIAALSFVASSYTANAQTYTVSDLGAVADFSEATGAAGVNARGDAAGQSVLPAGPDRPFFWRNGQSLDLGTLGGPGAGARGINALDVIAGTSDTTDGFFHAVLWVPSRPAFAAGAFTISDLGTFGGFASEANSLNVLSHVSGYAYTTIPDPTFTLNFGEEGHGFVWDGSMHDMGTLGGPNSIAIGINDKDWLVGWSQASFDLGVFGFPDLHPVIWKKGVIRDMGSFGGPISLALGINNNGLAVGQSMLPDFSFHAFTWQNGVLSDLGTLPGDSQSGAGGVNSQGEIVGMSSNDTTQAACLWQHRIPVDLNTRISDPAWQLASANGINDRGQIAGYGFLNGELHAFLLTPSQNGQSSSTLSGGRPTLLTKGARSTMWQRIGLSPDRIDNTLMQLGK